MTDNNNYEEEDEDSDVMLYFDDILYQALSPKIKDYLFNNYQDILLHLEPDEYTELENLIKENFKFHADEIASSLYRNRTIEDLDEYDKSFDNFVPDNMPVLWPVTEHWFFRQYVTDDDDNFNYLNRLEMTDEKRRMYDSIRMLDQMEIESHLFAGFLKQGYLHFNPVLHLYLEQNASFELAFSSPEGIVECQDHIDTLVVCLLEDLHALFYL